MCLKWWNRYPIFLFFCKSCVRVYHFLFWVILVIEFPIFFTLFSCGPSGRKRCINTVNNNTMAKERRENVAIMYTNTNQSPSILFRWIIIARTNKHYINLNCLSNKLLLKWFKRRDLFLIWKNQDIFTS